MTQQMFFRVDLPDTTNAHSILTNEFTKRGSKIIKSLDIFVFNGGGYRGFYTIQEKVVEITIHTKPLGIMYPALISAIENALKEGI